MTDYYRSGQGPQPAYRAPPTRQLNHVEGWRRIGIVFVGAIVGGFVIWPLIRPVFLGDGSATSVPTAPRTPDGRPNNHSGLVRYGYPQGGDVTARRLRLPQTVGDGSATAEARSCQHFRFDGRRLFCDDRQDGPPPREAGRR
jgi:hypothetical protein